MFRTYETGPDFERARTQIATPFEYIDIALDTAASNQIFNVSGDFLYIDAVSDGVATLEVNNQYNDPAAPFQIQAGFGLQCLFKQIKLSWTAQAGKSLRVMYSTGARVVPTNVMQVSLNAAPRFSGTNGAVTVTTTEAQIVAAKSDRSYLMIQNNHGSDTIYVGFGSAAVTSSNGFKIGPGGFLEFNCNIPTDAIRAIGGVASNTAVIVLEG